GPAGFGFWTFWISHLTIMVCAVYDLAVLKFRPDWSDLGRAALMSLAYVALIIPIDLWLGANYGFVGNPPPGHHLPPMIEAMGSSPGRVLVLIALALVGFALVLSPWLLARRVQSRDDLASGAPAVEKSSV